MRRTAYDLPFDGALRKEAIKLVKEERKAAKEAAKADKKPKKGKK